jgi:hypothetical protein
MFDATDAKCRETDPEIFFPEHTQPQNEIKVILSLCSNCPVFTKCFNYALQHDVVGWWAGTTYADREKIRKTKRFRPKPILIMPQDTVLAETPDAKKMREYRKRKRIQRENERKISYGSA